MTRTLLKENKHKYLHDALGYVLEEALIDEIIKVSQVKDVLADEVILNVGDSMQYIPIVLEGSIKISRENDEGDELLLYYIEGGDTCAMTLQCCVRQTSSEIKATSMEDSLLLMIPVEMMEIWMNKYKSWREFILSRRRRTSSWSGRTPGWKARSASSSASGKRSPIMSK